MLDYKDIKKATNYGTFRSRNISELVCMNLSPFFSKFFIKLKVIPNTITLLMVIFGIIGGILFCIPNLSCKILGIICFFLWFIMDCSDGEVARYTKHFSKYGKEMDFMAHIIYHTFVNFSFWMTYIQMGKYNNFYITGIFILFISFELIARNIIAFEELDSNKKEKSNLPFNPSWPKYIFIQFAYYPNIVLFFPIVILLDYIGILNSFNILIVVFLLNIINVINMYVKELIHFYKS